MTPFDPRLPIIAAHAKVKTCHAYHCWHAMREMGNNFHIGAFASFAGLECRHVAAIMAAIEQHAPLTAKREPVTRGSRLPNDWTLPAEWASWAMLTRFWSPVEVAEEAEIFANYWQAKSGAAAVKIAWEKTWRNWVRQSHRPNGAYMPKVDAPTDHREQMARTAALYEKMGRTDEAAELRAKLAGSDNVIQFPLGEPETHAKSAIL